MDRVLVVVAVAAEPELVLQDRRPVATAVLMVVAVAVRAQVALPLAQVALEDKVLLSSSILPLQQQHSWQFLQSHF